MHNACINYFNANQLLQQHGSCVPAAACTLNFKHMLWAFAQAVQSSTMTPASCGSMPNPEEFSSFFCLVMCDWRCRARCTSSSNCDEGGEEHCAHRPDCCLHHPPAQSGDLPGPIHMHKSMRGTDCACSHVLLRSLLIQRMVSMAWAAINIAMAQCNRHADLHALKLWLVVQRLSADCHPCRHQWRRVWTLASTAQGVFTELW